MKFLDWFRSESKHFRATHLPLPSGVKTAVADVHYVRLWLVQMMLKDGRKLFDEYTPGAFDWAISRALARFADREAWSTRMRVAMTRDFGWERAAERYDEVYRKATLALAQRDTVVSGPFRPAHCQCHVGISQE